MKKYLIPSIGLLIGLSLIIGGLIANVPPASKCPDCGETNCIYQQINNSVKGEGTDQEIDQAIQSVCKERGIIDPKTIDLLRANYYL